ncbi:MAG: hypothetical protein ACD_75C00185G0004 [uncultured bacterium]|nr:MAG: hypothetical protein ACD_75C00185G0004 [uncultured bacterium]
MVFQKISDRAFTLLEVMIAVAIIAIAMVTLLGSQARSLSHATEAHFNVVAPMLASLKLAEMAGGVIPAVNDDGDFGEDFSGYKWKMEVEDAEFATSEVLGALTEPLQKVELTVWWSDTPYSYTITSYGRSPN